MELDDLKESWKKDNEKSNLNLNIMELIQRKSGGPIEVLKKIFKKKFLVLTMVTCTLAMQNITLWNNDLMMWLFIAFCGLIGGYYYTRYNLLDDMQTLDMAVSNNIQKQVITLEKGVAFHLAVLQVMPVVLAVALEILMYHHREPFFEDWYNQPVYLRAGCYIGLFGIFFIIKQYTIDRNFTRHIRHLKDLATQL
jgi:hypothetical protein